jgi:hypothetical protein
MEKKIKNKINFFLDEKTAKKPKKKPLGLILY